jgi:hypothetical protein
MSVKIDPQTKTYKFAEGEHKLRDILDHYSVERGGADEIREKILEPVHRRYYSKEASRDQLSFWVNRFLSPDKELPTSVLSDFCRATKRIPEELKAVAQAS